MKAINRDQLFTAGCLSLLVTSLILNRPDVQSDYDAAAL